jgi:DNA-binding NarL/FixJ family response regulator
MYSKTAEPHYSTAAVVGFANVEQMSEAEDGPFDVVVLDRQLRGGDVEGSDAVRASTSRGRVLVFSSLTSGDALQRAHTAGAQGYVSKDTSPITLIEGVDAVLAGRPFVDPEMQAKIGASERKLLTECQQEVLRLEALGCNVAQIALELAVRRVRGAAVIRPADRCGESCCSCFGAIGSRCCAAHRR